MSRKNTVCVSLSTSVPARRSATPRRALPAARRQRKSHPAGQFFVILPLVNLRLVVNKHGAVLRHLARPPEVAGRSSELAGLRRAGLLCLAWLHRGFLSESKLLCQN